MGMFRSDDEDDGDDEVQGEDRTPVSGERRVVPLLPARQAHGKKRAR